MVPGVAGSVIAGRLVKAPVMETIWKRGCSLLIEGCLSLADFLQLRPNSELPSTSMSEHHAPQIGRAPESLKCHA